MLTELLEHLTNAGPEVNTIGDEITPFYDKEK